MSTVHTGAEDDDAYCELSFSPNVRLIATVRRFVGEFYDNVLLNAKVTSRLVVASHELLENAVRYSVDGKSRIRIGVVKEGANFRVSIGTQNRTDPERCREVIDLVTKLSSSLDRAKVYQELLARSAKRTTGSGLGLGRIYAESELDLTCAIEGGVVHLVAQGVFNSDGEKA